jgi:hypothetical protein
VEAFLRDLAGRPFRYGEVDCILALADWLLLTGRNRDPAEAYRGTYSDEDGYLAILRPAGGLARFVRSMAAEMCLARVRPATAECGAIAVVRHQGQHFGAIRCPSGRWAIKCNDGLVFARDIRVVAAWGV